MTLTAEQLEQLRTVGWTRIPGVVGAGEAEAMAARIWDLYAKRGVVRDDPTTWPVGLTSKNQELRRSGALDRFTNPRTERLLDELLGAGSWTDSGGWGQALITWPQPGPWEVPHRNWHLDLPGRGDPDRPEAARLFGYISDVRAGGGATVVVEGSHELVRRMVAASALHDAGDSSQLRRRLMAGHQWFAELSRSGPERVKRFMVDGDDIDGVHVRVVELTGAPGDVVVMMPWTLHAFAPNTSTEPRFMVTNTVLRQGQRFYP